MRLLAWGVGAAVVLATAITAAGCDADGGPEQRVDPRAKPPPGWVSLANRSGRFTFAAPARWRVLRQAKEISVQSPTLTTLVSLRADRSPAGQRTPAREYAFDVLRKLPGFEGRVVRGPGRVPGARYGNARVSAVGKLMGAVGRQRVSVIALRIPDQVTYVVTVRGGAEPAAANEIVRTVRSGLGQRSGRSG